ncbi:MAG: hypothetical protein DELT_03247 [Desulfovibrio sp.]
MFSTSATCWSTSLPAFKDTNSIPLSLHAASKPSFTIATHGLASSEPENAILYCDSPPPSAVSAGALSAAEAEASAEALSDGAAGCCAQAVNIKMPTTKIASIQTNFFFMFTSNFSL